MGTNAPDRAVRIWCGPETPPDGWESSLPDPLNSIPPHENVFLKAENISRRLAQNLPPLAFDLLEVAAYVYCADQSKSRSSPTFPNNGVDWYRDFELEIPVRCLDVWASPEVTEKLSDLLRFLSDDQYDFRFRKLTKDVPQETYFDFGEEQPWFKPDSILLFSGGLDSLTGAIDELQDPGRKIVLVSHRPVAKIDSTQRFLTDELHRRFDAKSRLLHVPVWVNKRSGITKDANQRTRSFLFGALAAVVAMLSDTREIKFYENGIVSCNLPIADQVVGARASRSTHPKSLKLMSEFFSALFQESFSVKNPYWNKTKSDVLSLLKSFGQTGLIESAHSCTRTRATTGPQTHCGVCSQCIERRLAVQWNDLEDDDPEEYYKIKLFCDPLVNQDDVVMVESYVGHSRSLEEFTIEDFYERFPGGFDIVRAMDMSDMEAGQAIFDLHQRHGRQVAEVIQSQIALHSETIRKGIVHPKSLLGMIVAGSSREVTVVDSTRRFPTPAGISWEGIEIQLVSRDSVLIRAGSVSKRYHGFDMGFRDARRVDMLNSQWELLESLAESNGSFDWQSKGLKRSTQKRVEELSKTLKKFFGIKENPLHRYKKGVGWVARFSISDKSYGKS